MPRLIRLISENNTGHFDNTFEDEIVLPPYSKMMLHNLQATLPDTVINIDSLNQQVEFYLGSPDEPQTSFGKITTYLPPGSYTGEGSGDRFAKQFENTLNGALSTNVGYESGVRNSEGVEVLAGRSGNIKEVGGEWNVGITEPNSATTDRDLPFIEYNIQTLYEMKESETLDGNIQAGQGFHSEYLEEVAISGVPVGTGGGHIQKYFSTTASETNENPEAYVYGDSFMARGGGVFGTFVRKIDSSVGDESEQGFVMGFCVEDPNNFLKKGDKEFPLSKIMYGIQYTSVSGIYAIANGDGYKGSDGEDQLDADTFELKGNWDDDDNTVGKKPQLQFGFGQRIDALATQETKSVLNFRLFCPETQDTGAGDIESNYYTGWNRYEKNSSGNWVDSGSDDFTNYMDTTDLFPVVAFWSKRGAGLDLVLCDLTFTMSPSLDPPTSSLTASHGLDPAPTQTSQIWFNINNEIQDFFNFGDRLPTEENPHTYTDTFRINGHETITSDINPETFVVELMTYQLDSYDGKLLTTNTEGNPIQKGKGKRVSILATIPRNPSYSSRSLIYEGNDPYYIDLNNESPILMRNLFLRLLDYDLQPVVMRGRGCLTLLVK